MTGQGEQTGFIGLKGYDKKNEAEFEETLRKFCPQLTSSLKVVSTNVHFKRMFIARQSAGHTEQTG